MRRVGLRTYIYYTMAWLEVGAGIVVAAFAAAQPFQPIVQLPTAKLIVDFLANWSIAVVPIGTLVLLLAKTLKGVAGAPWIWKSIDAILDEFRDQVFRKADDDPLHFHRATIFKHVEWYWACLWPGRWRCRLWPWGPGRWPCSGWLVPIARSGHTTQRTSTVFLAPDDADNAEGVAGMTWSQNKTLSVKDLPDLSNCWSAKNAASEDGPDPEVEMSKYASSSWVDKTWVASHLRKGHKLPRSLCGVPIEVNGNRWGVLVLDSRSADGIKTTRMDHYYRMIAIVLGHLVRRIR